MLSARSTLLAAALLVVLAPAAEAGVPRIVANVTKGTPSATAGPAGVFHLVWSDEGSHLVTYCQTRKSDPTSCVKKSLLPFDSQPSSASRPVSPLPSPSTVTPPQSRISAAMPGIVWSAPAARAQLSCSESAGLPSAAAPRGRRR